MKHAILPTAVLIAAGAASGLSWWQQVPPIPPTAPPQPGPPHSVAPTIVTTVERTAPAFIAPATAAAPAIASDFATGSVTTSNIAVAGMPGQGGPPVSVTTANGQVFATGGGAPSVIVQRYGQVPVLGAPMMHGAMVAPWNERDAEFEHRSRELAMQLMQLSREDEEYDSKKEKLVALVTEHFEYRQQQRREEIEKLKRQLAEIESNFEDRQERASQIVERRVNDLLRQPNLDDFYEDQPGMPGVANPPGIGGGWMMPGGGPPQMNVFRWQSIPQPPTVSRPARVPGEAPVPPSPPTAAPPLRIELRQQQMQGIRGALLGAESRIRQAEVRRGLSERMAQIAEERLKAARVRHDSGTVSVNELLDAQVEFEKARTEVEAMTAEIEGMRAELEALRAQVEALSATSEADEEAVEGAAEAAEEAFEPEGEPEEDLFEDENV